MMENTKEKLTFYVTFMVSITLCISVLAMVAAFLLGLWAKQVDNQEIFKMLSPAFSTLIGGMIGFLSGIKLNQSEDDKPKESKNDGTRCAAASGRETDRQADT
jgi:archaellum biogenesis protein FlaJ (TadC family)